MANIDVKIIADSISAGGERITTYELEYPRFIHSELIVKFNQLRMAKYMIGGVLSCSNKTSTRSGICQSFRRRRLEE